MILPNEEVKILQRLAELNIRMGNETNYMTDWEDGSRETLTTIINLLAPREEDKP